MLDIRYVKGFSFVPTRKLNQFIRNDEDSDQTEQIHLKRKYKDYQLQNNRKGFNYTDQQIRHSKPFFEKNKRKGH